MQLNQRIVPAALALVLSFASAAADPTLLVVVKGEHSVQLFNALTLDSLAMIRTGQKPHEIVASPDGRYAYVSNYKGRDNSVTIIDIAKRKNIGEIPLTPYSHAHGLDISSDGSRLYVTVESRRCAVEIDLASREVTRAFKTLEQVSHMCSLAPDDQTFVISNSRAGNVSVFDLATGEMVRYIVSGRGVEGSDFTPDGRFLWTANGDANTVAVLDLETGRRIKVMERPGFPLRIRITPDGKEAWVTCATYSKVAVFDTESFDQIAEVRVGNVPIGITIDAAGERVYVTNQDDNNLVMIDRAQKKIIQTVDTGSRPDGITWIR